MTRLLSVCDVRKSFGDASALGGVSFEICPGHVYTILGRNGAGKTTLISIVAGLLKPTSGEVAWADGPRCGLTSIGFAGQELALYPLLTASENLDFFGRLAGMRSADCRTQVEHLAKRLRLTDLLDTPVRYLSVGQQRRVHVAAAMMGEPDLLLLDEPTAGVDIESRELIVGVVSDLAANGVAVVYSTHYLKEVEGFRSTILVLDAGTILASGSIDELTSEHGMTFVEVVFEKATPSELLAGLGTNAEIVDDRLRVRLETESGFTGVPEVLRGLAPWIDSVRALNVVRPSLESVFISLTKRGIDPRGN